MSFRWPVDKFTLSQAFGGNADYYKQFGQIGHNGHDLAVPTNTPVYAADEGTIYFEGWGQNHSWMGAPAGICVLIDNVGSYSGYAHLASTLVNKGQHVNKGQLIGYSDTTGAATGPHVHFEMLPKSPNFKNGYAGRIDVTPYIDNNAQGGKDMTPNFIKRAYYMIANQTPSQADIDFHMAKSNPESFINGFGDNPKWLIEEGQVTNLQAQVNAANQQVADRDAQITELKKNQGGIDQATKDQITQTAIDTSWLKKLLAKVFNQN